MGLAYAECYLGSKLMQMVVKTTTTPAGGTATTTTEVLNFTYDASGIPMSVNYNGTVYYYNTNIQGDVTGIMNSSGTVVVSYTYDAWGKPLTVTGSMSSTLGAANPLRYRSYVYDTETSLYYLQSRYYDPEVGRFINADGLVATGQGLLGNNMFTYCNNSPISFSDPYGYAAGRSYTCYDKGGGYYFYCPQSDDPEVSSLLKHVEAQTIESWGSYPPSTSVVICCPTYETITESEVNDIIVDLALSSLVGGALYFLITKDVYGLGILAPYKHLSATLGVLGQHQLNKLIINDLPAGEYNVYAVTIAECYRLVDPGTGQFYGWRCVTTTRYYVNCGQWIEVTDRWD